MCHARRHFFKFAESRCLEMGDSRPSGSSVGSGEEFGCGRHLFKFAEFRCLEMGDPRPSGSSLGSGEAFGCGRHFFKFAGSKMSGNGYLRP